MTMQKLSMIEGVDFNGVNHPYVPPKTLKIDPKLKLHREFDTDIDPVTFEVIRHNLWNINEEHGNTIQRISGSPVAVYAIDLNPSILTEDAEFVYFGPFMQYMSGVTDTQVKWTLENRSSNPGIEDGDMFISNDPWVGAAHQSDVLLLCPVFHEGELFCWVTNCLHQYDIGGVTPGSFCIPARDVYDEGILLPPTKIVERGELRSDIEALYVRASRRPDMVSLDLRAQIAGNTAARERVKKLIDRYGARVVKGVMKRIIDNGEKAFLDKLATLPDGVYQERTYVECASIGDRNVYPVMTRMIKEGTTLTFENEGTAEQMGAMNATYSGWRGSIMVVLNQVLCWDQYFAIGGALRHVNFDPTPGTFTCANFPASVSTAPVQAMEIALYPVYNVLAKLVYSNPDLRPDILGMSGSSQMPLTNYRGMDQHGEKFGYVVLDMLAGAIGAFANGDGISTGGQSRTPISKIPNVEFTEHQFPILYLYRRESCDSGGAGQYRGGLSGESCWVTHHVDVITHEALSSGTALPSSLGMMGGYPSMTNQMDLVRGTDVQAWFADGRLPAAITEAGGSHWPVPPRSEPFAQTKDDIFAIRWCGGGGFGDPLRRAPEDIEADIENFAVSPESAETIFGAVLAPDRRKVDVAATATKRAGLKAARRAPDDKQPARRDGQVRLGITPSLDVREDADGAFYACACCGTWLADLGTNFKSGCTVESRDIQASNPLIGDPHLHVDNAISFREFFCPGCGEQLDAEVVVDNAPPNFDVDIRSLPER
ncbi:hydantoinase B/oxoprolinase family protein [Antarctobacter sp.]|uniref:hydantoinase B/oxoprolinase family protein n=1 Tax=Antarctobacter sp. TaxID=1872577 RepID=UPI003A8D2CCB